MGTVTIGVVNYREMPPKGASGTKRSTLFISEIEHDLRERGLQFDSVSPLPIATRSEEDGNGTSIQVLGLRSEDGLITDHILNFRSDGTATSTTTFLPTTEHITKRHDGPGFKMSYKFLVNTWSQIDRGATKILAVNFGKDWETRVSTNQAISSYFGKAQFTPDHVMGFRISPMASSYDDSYEDVDACGTITA